MLRSGIFDLCACASCSSQTKSSLDICFCSLRLLAQAICPWDESCLPGPQSESPDRSWQLYLRGVSDQGEWAGSKIIHCMVSEMLGVSSLHQKNHEFRRSAKARLQDKCMRRLVCFNFADAFGHKSEPFGYPLSKTSSFRDT